MSEPRLSPASLVAPATPNTEQDPDRFDPILERFSVVYALFMAWLTAELDLGPAPISMRAAAEACYDESEGLAAINRLAHPRILASLDEWPVSVPRPAAPEAEPLDWSIRWEHLPPAWRRRWRRLYEERETAGQWPEPPSPKWVEEESEEESEGSVYSFEFDDWYYKRYEEWCDSVDEEYAREHRRSFRDDWVAEHYDEFRERYGRAPWENSDDEEKEEWESAEWDSEEGDEDGEEGGERGQDADADAEGESDGHNVVPAALERAGVSVCVVTPEQMAALRASMMPRA